MSQVIVVSIGTLARNLLWNERSETRTSHATTTLITSGDRQILVDPSLPGQVLDARLFERAGIHADAITDVFLTSFKPVHRRGLGAFRKATWYLHAPERDAAQRGLTAALERARAGAALDLEPLELDQELLERLQDAPDELTAGVSLFPLPGYTPGQCGLLVAQPTRTVIIAGDAVATEGHFIAGQVLPGAYDLEQAKASLLELYEIADMIVPGHDNVFVNPRIAGM
ncbi:MAG: MBL fold metallo-hydrolase [Phycisphaerae bacterium]